MLEEERKEGLGMDQWDNERKRSGSKWGRNFLKGMKEREKAKD